MSSFDDDLQLSDLLDAKHQSQLMALLERLCGSRFDLVEVASENSEPIDFNLMTVAWLTGGTQYQRTAAIQLLQFILLFVGKYRLAADFHRDLTEENYKELTLKHEALKRSENRFRALSLELQQRVDEQVLLIDKAHRDLYESARLRSVGQLSAGVAHEINNPISFIISNLRIAQDYLTELSAVSFDPPQKDLLNDFRELISESLGGAHRISAIVKDLRIFSNIDKSDFVSFDLEELLNATCRLVQNECTRGQRIELTLGPLPPWRGYPAKLSQAIYNVLDNAVKASDEGGLIEVRCDVKSDTVEITVKDLGSGMSNETLARVFDPFYTTRDVGGGTGLGLTVTRDILRAHGGDIVIVSEPGEGCTVSMTLKLAEKG